MNRVVSRIAGLAALMALALAFSSALTSCGSGAVGPPTQVNDPTRIVVQPQTAIAYSGLPTTLVISGGSGAYIVSSSNQAIIQVAGNVIGGSLTIIPNPVVTDTDVTLTVRDTGTTPTVNATVTVKPGTVANDITITPSSTQAANCTPAVCSGGDAVVSATISQGGIPLAARGVIFTTVSGDFRFITSPPGVAETLDTQTTVFTDETGRAQARIRILPNAPNQTALLQVTDQGTGAYQRATFVIAQSTGSSPGFFASPDTIEFQGPNASQCAGNEVVAGIFIFGGVPPYTVGSSSSAFTVSRTFIDASGGGFSVRATGQCSSAVPIIVTDSAGHTATITVSNIVGTAPAPVLVAGPSPLTLTSCSSMASFTVAGGTGNYITGVSNNALLVNRSGAIFTVQRASPSPATTSPQTVTVSDGQTSVDIEVDLTGQGAGACPALTTNPSAVTLSCGGSATVVISGGTTPYSAASGSNRVTATISGSTLTISRSTGDAPPPASVSSPVTVSLTDSSIPPRQGTVSVTVPANCP